MRLVKLKIKNFRGYREEVEVEFGNLTTFVGKNDVGKSTVLEALDIFFNEGKGVVKLDKEDINKEALENDDKEIVFTATFDNLPPEIIIDSTSRTTLENEYLLNSNNQLEVIKKYPNATSTAKVFIKANHPNGENTSNLLQKKITDLKKTIKDNSIECDNQSSKPVMRSSIWNHFNDELALDEVEVDISKEDGKAIWDNLKQYMPLYSLFQSDRRNSDNDAEVQEPLKEAVKIIMRNEDVQEKLNEVAELVKSQLEDVAVRTVEKLREMDEEIANSLNPNIPSSADLKWTDVFKNVSITGDGDIPINKRGSGVKRLVLLNFFRAEAERKKEADSFPSVIYAIEEPETSQHSTYQSVLIQALKDLGSEINTQVILTTHSSTIVKQLEFEHLRLIKQSDDIKTIESVDERELPYPSLNEINFVAFDEVTEEYHIELYSYIVTNDMFSDYKSGKPEINYNQLHRNGNIQQTRKILTEYIRHQIHHPENEHNPKYTKEQLTESVNLMRDFINANMS